MQNLLTSLVNCCTLGVEEHVLRVSRSWGTCPSSVVTPQTQTSQSQMRTPGDTLIKSNSVGQDDCNIASAAGLTSQPFAIAKPPPSNKMMFQGTVSWAFLQVSKGCVSVFGARWERTAVSNTHPTRSTSVITWQSDVMSLTSVLKLTNHKLLVVKIYIWVS